MTSGIVRDAIEALNIAGKDRVIRLCWTKAHVGTVGNEMADGLAKSGSTGNNFVSVNVPLSELNTKINETMYKIWEGDFQGYEGARMGKCFYAKPDEILGGPIGEN